MLQQDIINSILLMTVNGNRLELPTQQIHNYPEVKKALVKAGGKYVKNGFNFPTDAQEIKDRLCGGEAIDDKKKFQFFPTPQGLAQRMVEMADIKSDDLVLEPSAGTGAIAKEMLKKDLNQLTLIELNPVMAANLSKEYSNPQYEDLVQVFEEDFLAYDTDYYFDKIIANPPFTKGQDVDHIMKMYEYLMPGTGVMVVLSSASWTFRKEKKYSDFKQFIEDVGAEVEELPEGTFKESGTNIRTMLIRIQKPV